MSKIAIYRFSIYDISTDETKISRRWGTLEGIEGVCGTPLEHTQIEGDASDVGTEVPGLTARNLDPHKSDGFQDQVR
jgi:hypothetical protein